MITRFFGKREWGLVAIAIALILCQVWMDMRIPQYMNTITDSFLLERLDVVSQCGIEMLLCAFISLGLAIVAGFVLSNLSASVGRNIRLAQFDRIRSFSLEDIDRFSTDSLITRSTNDVTQIQNFITRGMQVAIKSPIVAIWAVCMIAGTSMEWTSVTATGVIVLVVVMGVSVYYASKRYARVQWLTDNVNRATRENIDGIRVIRAYNAEDHQESKFEKATGDLLENNLSAIRIMTPGFPIAHAVMNFVTLGIYWVGMGVISSAGTQDAQLMLFSDMIVFTSYATMVISSFMQLFSIMRVMPRMLVGLRRIEEVVDTEPSIKDGPVDDQSGEGSIEFRDVSFRYPGAQRDALSGITLKVEPGTTLAIIGSTGSGKTTLVNLIARLYDATSGEVLVDGRDVREYTLHALHSRMGYVTQSATLFSGSVKMNVNYGHGSENRDDEDIAKALRVAKADSFVDDLPEKTESNISQHGRNLSGGQKQRISIARAICRSPRILILDDTFSALDFKTDLELRTALRREMSGSTVVIVAQRIGTIRDADRIVVLEGGRIVGIGTHDELMSGCETYRDMARSQFTGEMQ
ncbi:MAG: ABC transporter ATP-binding protein [Candidatus Methanomethylophilaceae archaeon]|nr:ABC transporter ATP-binding protein [Candidatus Methanomethylophilaceae archaeon]